jgi:predicted kinase
METNRVHIVYGPVGAGKSTCAIELGKKNKSIRFSGDEWFRTLFFDDIDKPRSPEWTVERYLRCETQIWNLTHQIIDSGLDVTLDLGLPRKVDRRRIHHLCEEVGIKHQFYYITAETETRWQRVVNRNQGASETYEFGLTPEMFEIVDKMFELPDEEELSRAVVYYNNNESGPVSWK